MSLRRVNGASEAAKILERESDSLLGLLIQLADDNNGAGLFELEQFTDALERHECVQRLRLDRGLFDHPDEAIDHLFGIVLPRHRSLTVVAFVECKIMPEYLESFANSIASGKSGLRSIEIYATAIDYRSAAALAGILRSKTLIETLDLSSCSIDSHGCQVIFEALNGNTQLRTLNLYNNKITEISMSAVRALGNSNLVRLDMRYNPLSSESSRELAEGLKANYSLGELYIGGGSCRINFSDFDELLTSFNFTLRTLSSFGAYDVCQPSGATRPQQKIDRLLKLNKHVRNAYVNLQRSNFDFPLLILWPQILGRITSKPSLIFRFLREGKLDLFATHLLTGPSEKKSTGRRRNCMVQFIYLQLMRLNPKK